MLQLVSKRVMRWLLVLLSYPLILKISTNLEKGDVPEVLESEKFVDATGLKSLTLMS